MTQVALRRQCSRVPGFAIRPLVLSKETPEAKKIAIVHTPLRPLLWTLS
jgi:hypothetical protein